MTLHVRLIDPITGLVLARETVATLRAAVQGPRGLSAYQVAVANGYEGTEEEWLESIGSGGGGPGASAYEVAVANGFVGDEAAWLASLEGEPGDPGASAYEVAVANGFVGDEAAWLASLEGEPGDPGASAYEVAVANGFVGDEAAWLASLEGDPGDPGASAYEVAVANGFVGDEAAWLASLEGEPGDPGASAYEVAVANGFVGDEAAWLASLEGEPGEDGAVPVVGALIAGRYYACGGIGIGAGTINVTGASGRVDLAPRPRRRLYGPLAGIGTMIQSGGGLGALVRIVFYLPDADGWPDELLWQSASLDASSFAFREVTSGLPDLDAHPLLWYGIAHEGSATTQVRSHNISDTIEIGGWAPGATPSPNPGTVIRRTGVSLGALPDPWVFNAAELTALVNPPLIYLRVA